MKGNISILNEILFFDSVGISNLSTNLNKDLTINGSRYDKDRKYVYSYRTQYVQKRIDLYYL